VLGLKPTIGEYGCQWGSGPTFKRGYKLSSLYCLVTREWSRDALDGSLRTRKPELFSMALREFAREIRASEENKSRSCW
jgi:hypothetical protein